MKTLRILIVTGAVFLTGCAPVLIRYMHVVVRETTALRVTDRSTESKASDGSALWSPKIGLPTKAVLTRPAYVVQLSTPVNPITVAFLKVHDEKGNELQIVGKNLYALDKRSGGWIGGDRYTFYVADAKGAPMEFDVINEAGVVLGHERIDYDLVSRGYVWAMNTL